MKIKISKNKFVRLLSLSEDITKDKAMKMIQSLYDSDKIDCDSFILFDNDNVIYSLERVKINE